MTYLGADGDGTGDLSTVSSVRSTINRHVGRYDGEQDGHHVICMVQVRSHLVVASNREITRGVARGVAGGAAVAALHAHDRTGRVETKHDGVDVFGRLLRGQHFEADDLGRVEDVAVDCGRWNVLGVVCEVHDGK